MADFLIDNELLSSTPAASKSILAVDSTTKKFYQLDDSGSPHGILSRNFATSAQGLIAATEVYLTGSSILIPSFGMKAGMTFFWYISASKTAAGVVAPIWKFYIGSNQSTADTLRLTCTSVELQVATLADGLLVAMITVPTVGATGTIAGNGGSHANFGGGGSTVSSTFDNTATIAGQYLGLSVTGGTNAAWTINALSAFLLA